MLIKALCDYYDVLEKQGKVLDDAYSRVGISYIVSLTKNGEIDGIIDCRETEVTVKKDKSGKETVKERRIPKTMILPRREDSTSIYAYIIDHRLDYIFGLTCGENEELTEEYPKDKTRKSHAAFVKRNAAVFEDSRDPVCRAYYRFVTEWDPKKGTENTYLARLCKDNKKKLNTSGFAFCLSGRPDLLLHESEEAKRLWEEHYNGMTSEKLSSMKRGFCSVYGREMLIPEIHDGIKAFKGMPPKVVCQNSDGEWSYGQKKAVGSSISYDAMKRYTKALDYLLSDPLHNSKFGDTMVIHWASSGNEECDSIFEESSGIETKELDTAVCKAMRGAADGTTPVDTKAVIESLKDETFYVVGIGLNKTRIIPRFVYRDCFGNIMRNVSEHQRDISIRENSRMVPLWAIEKELISPKTTDEKKKKINSRLSEDLLNAVIRGTKYPVTMYRTALHRIQTDSDTENNAFIKINDTRLGILKGYINRMCRKTGTKEKIKMNLDKENTSRPYLCGRLFAVLESIQYQASDGKLNRTIRDTYFDKTSKMPARYLPKLITLSNHHVDKKDLTAAEAERNEIIAMFGKNGNCQFPQKLSYIEQGEFIIGYAQQKNYNIERAKKAAAEKNAQKNT